MARSSARRIRRLSRDHREKAAQLHRIFWRIISAFCDSKSINIGRAIESATELDAAAGQQIVADLQTQIRRRPNDRIFRSIRRFSAACAFASAATSGTAACATVSSACSNNFNLTNHHEQHSGRNRNADRGAENLDHQKQRRRRARSGRRRRPHRRPERGDVERNDRVPERRVRPRAQPRGNRGRRHSPRRSDEGRGRRRGQDDRQAAPGAGRQSTCSAAS